MKNGILFLSFLLVGCKPSSKTETLNTVQQDTVLAGSSAQNDSMTVPVTRQHHSAWMIPLTEYWKSPETFVLLIPDSSGGIKVEAKNSGNPVSEDTVQGKILKRIESDFQYCDENKISFLVELRNGVKGVVDCSQVLVIGDLDKGIYVIPDGRQFRFGAMNARRVDDADNGCSVVHTLFLYDTENLYLIEAGNSEHRLPRQRHLSVVNQVPGISVSGRTDGNQFVINWSEPNVTNELRIEWKGDHATFVSYYVNNLDSDVADIPGDEEQ